MFSRFNMAIAFEHLLDYFQVYCPSPVLSKFILRYHIQMCLHMHIYNNALRNNWRNIIRK